MQLLNHILTVEHGKKLAIIENEFGEVGIDDSLLKQNTMMHEEEEIIEMMNGACERARARAPIPGHDPTRDGVPTPPAGARA